MKPFCAELWTGLLSIGLNYLATFKIPSTSLLKDPLETLSTAIPILLVGHVVLIIFAHMIRGTTDRLMKTVGCSILATIIGTGILHIITVCFGAPLTEKIPNTLLFASYLSILTVMPAFQCLYEPVWLKVFLQHSPTTASEIYAYAQSVCALSGAWIGAIVLPLDWDREWQAWPISCVISTYVGHSVGVMAGFVWSSLKMIFGKKKSE